MIPEGGTSRSVPVYADLPPAGGPVLGFHLLARVPVELPIGKMLNQLQVWLINLTKGDRSMIIRINADLLASFLCIGDLVTGPINALGEQRQTVLDGPA